MKQLFQKLLLASTLILISTATVQAVETVSLAGKWRFEIANTNAPIYSSRLSDATQIYLPGTMDDAGLGPKNTNSPTLAGPWRRYNYAGPAWYQRDIEIPAGWQGKRVTLFLERCRWVATVWLDDRFIGTQDSLIAPHLFDFGTGVGPGKHRLTICVDNTVKLDLGRFVSALSGGTPGDMNGIVGCIELAATPPIWIDDVQVYPDVAKKQARVVIKIGNATGQPGHGQLIVNGQSHDVSWNENGGQTQITVDMRGAKLWDEFSPNLSEVTVKLGSDTCTVRFGMRNFAEKGTQFTMNGRPIFLRGTLECSVWPLTGYPSTDVKSWLRIFRIEKSYGLNFIRFHSWCPPEAAFTAADKAGIMIQVEGPQANVQVGKDPDRDKFVESELKRIVDVYGNHPSFCLITVGNELWDNDDTTARWVDMLIHRDPRHLYSSSSGGQTTTNRQWTETGEGRGIRGPGTERDLREVVASDKRPIIGHEIGQWMYWPDFYEIKKWTGVMALKNFELIRDDMAKKHLLDQESDFVQAGGRFATLLYKEEIEVLLRTPGYGGFSLLDLHDYPTQGTAVVGPLDAFWDSKSFVTPKQFHRYCSPTVPLLRMSKRVYTSDETFTASADLANYGPSDLNEIQPVWSIRDEHGHEIASGQLPSVAAPTGKLTPLGEIHASFASASVPCKLNVSLKGTKFFNDWDIWVYPDKVSPQPLTNVTICDKWEDAKAALAAGKKVIFFPHTRNPKQSLRGSFLPVFWSPAWFPQQQPNTMGILCDPQHPLFVRFPTEMNTDWQWYNLMQHSRVFVLDDTPADYHPLVQVIDNFARNHKLGVIFEGRVGSGSLIVSGFDLPQLTKYPAARQLQASLYAYVGSGKFKPKSQLDPAMLDNLFASQSLNAHASADSQESDNYDADMAIDGDPDTIWHTAWNDPAPGFPHWLKLKLPRPEKLTGITVLPRQDGNRNGWIKQYAVYASDDGEYWGKAVAEGTFADNAELKTIRFSLPVTAKFLKLLAISGYSDGPWASLAEINFIPTKH